MDDVLRHLAAGNNGGALTRLWVLAERSVDATQTLSRWLARWDSQTHTDRVAQYRNLLQRKRLGPFPAAVLDHPLALIEALDAHHAERRTLAVVAPSAAPALSIDGMNYRLLRRLDAGGVKPPAEQLPPNLQGWFRHFRVVPERLQIDAADFTVKLEFLNYVTPRRAPTPDELRLRVSHFDDAAALQIDADRANKRFFATGLAPAEARARSIEAELAAVARDAADLWLAPELTVSADLRRQVADWLARQAPGHLLLCVPGSFHEHDGADRVNRAVVFSGNGRPVAWQDKSSLYSLPPADGALHEHIVARRCVTLLVTPIGTVGVAICKDHFDATASGQIRACWDRLAPDWLLVPSMGDAKTVAAHGKRAKEAWEVRRTRSVVANQEPRLSASAVAAAPGFIQRGPVAEPAAIGGTTFAPAGAPSLPPTRPAARLKRIK